MIKCYFDGSCGPKNPGGKMGFGVSIMKEGIEIEKYAHSTSPHPHNSNNVAEYAALEWTLNKLIELGLNEEPIHIHGDSMLVISQMQGKWKLKKGMYLEYAKACKALLPFFPKVKFEWIPRHLNQHADELSKA